MEVGESPDQVRDPCRVPATGSALRFEDDRKPQAAEQVPQLLDGGVGRHGDMPGARNPGALEDAALDHLVGQGQDDLRGVSLESELFPQAGCGQQLTVSKGDHAINADGPQVAGHRTRITSGDIHHCPEPGQQPGPRPEARITGLQDPHDVAALTEQLDEFER